MTEQHPDAQIDELAEFLHHLAFPNVMLDLFCGAGGAAMGYHPAYTEHIGRALLEHISQEAA